MAPGAAQASGTDSAAPATTVAAPAKDIPAEAATNLAVTPGYLLQPGDVLQVAVWKETDLTLEVLIRPDGGMSFPLAGELQAAGHTVAELTAMLEKRVRKLEPDAVVTVVVKAATGNRVYVIGKVARPGDFPLNRPTDVMQALSLAGGATPFANTNGIRILRRDGERQSSIAFRYSDVERGRKLDQNILLKSGDTVVVP
jgi:polysaccharide biosynthesis/export protein